MARGTIDQLNFEVILNDTKFDAQVRKDIALANQLNTSLTNSLNLRKKLVVEERAFATAAAKTATAQQKAQAAIEKSAKGITSTGISLNRAWLRFSATLWSVVSIVRIITQTLGKAIKNIADFQQANANLATIMQVSRKEIETLTNDALMLGRTTEWTASQVTELQTALAKLGYNIPQIKNMQASVLQFATAVGANLPDAANLAGAALRMFGMHSSEMQRALEILTASTNKTALDFEKLKVALPYAGSIAHSIGFDIAETSALLGVLTNAGLASSRAGTGLRQVLLELSKENGKLQTAMGGNIKTFDDFVRGLQLMRDRGLEAGEAAKLVSTRASSALLILANGVDDIRRLNAEVRDTDGLLKTIQGERLDTLHGSTLLLKSAWEGLIQTFRDSAGPMKDIVDWLTKIIRATSLAASRTNRIAQGTKDYKGSDELTKTYTEMYDRLRAQGHSEAEATRLVQEQMVNRLNMARDSFVEEINDLNNLQNKWWYKGMQYSPFMPLTPLARAGINKAVSKKANRGGESMEALQVAMSAVMEYINNQSGEEAEIAANNYLEEWKLVFDTKGADAARAASDSLIKSFSGNEDMTKRLVAMRDQLDEYIRAGGESGASGRGAGSSKTPKLTLEQKAWIAMMEETEDWLQKDFLKQLENNTDQLEKDYKTREKAQEDYDKLFREWSGKDFNKRGTGAVFDISSDIANYNNKNDAAQRKYEKALALAQIAHKGNAAAIKKEREELQKLLSAEKAANLAEFQEKIRGRANDLFKEGLAGFDLTNWDDKTLSQILEIIDAVENMDVPDEVKEMLDENTLGILEGELKTICEKYLNRTLSPEQLKIVARNIKFAAGQILGLAESFEELGEAVGNANLQQAAKAVSVIGDVAKSAGQGFTQAGPWGAVIGAVASMGKTVLSNIAESQRESARISQALRDAAIAYEQAADAMAVASTANVFGVNSMGQFREYVKIAEKYKKVVSDFYDKVGKKGLLGEAFVAGYTDAEGNMDLDRLEYDIENGLVAGGGIEDLLPAIKQYKEALKEVDGVIESIFGDIASSAADKIVNSWIEAGNAALDYADILDDVAKAYSKMLIQSVIMETALDPITDDLKKAFTENRYEDAMAMVANAMQTIEASAPVYEQILRAFDPYFNRSETTGSGGGLGSGIKSITEETASLLASYINAIRADVSTIRKFYENGFEGIAAFGAALPTLNDYLAQVSANTYDTAQNTNRILSELQSVIGAPGTSGMVVRVEAS